MFLKTAAENLRELKNVLREEEILGLVFAEFFLLEREEGRRRDIYVQLCGLLEKWRTEPEKRTGVEKLFRALRLEEIPQRILEKTSLIELAEEIAYEYRALAGGEGAFERILERLSGEIRILKELLLPVEIAELIGRLCGEVLEGKRLWLPYLRIGNLAAHMRCGRADKIYASERNERDGFLAQIYFYLCWGRLLEMKSPNPFFSEPEVYYDYIAGAVPFGTPEMRVPAGIDLAPLNAAGRYTESLAVWNLCSRLSERGRAVLLVPNGILFRNSYENDRRLRKILLEKGWLEKLVYLPPRLLAGTTVPCTVIVIQKGEKREEIELIDAEREPEWLIGGRRSRLTEAALEEIPEKGKKERPAVKVLAVRDCLSQDCRLDKQYLFYDGEKAEEGELSRRQLRQTAEDSWKRYAAARRETEERLKRLGF